MLATKKTYVMIARAIKETNMDEITRMLLIDKLCYEFGADNPRFDRDHFTEACQPKIRSICLIDDEGDDDKELATLCKCSCCKKDL